MKKESSFQSDFLDDIKVIFPESIILKNDSRYMQGVPDWIILYKNKYAMLEMKRSEHERHQPNQDYYVSFFNSQSAYSTFCYPENAAKVMAELINYFKGETKDEV